MAAEHPAAQDHEIEACFHNGEYWTVICSCAWEGWNMPTERAARAIHADHVCDPEPERHERFVDRVQGFAKLLPEYDLTDPEDARSVRRVLIDLALAAHLIEVEADPDASE